MQQDVIVVARAERKTVAEAGERYIQHLARVKQRKRTTVQDYRGYLRRHLVPYFGERTLERIGPEQVEAYLHAKLESLSPKTVTNHLTFMHGLFGFAIRRRWTDANPVALIDRPPATRQHSRRIRFLQPPEVEALLRAIPDDDLGAVERPLYLCAVMTGLRQGELLALKWLDVDWVARRIRVADNFPRGRTDEADSPKSHYLRSVPMADRIGGELERHFQRSLRSAEHDLVFCDPHSGEVLDASKLRNRFHECLERARVRRVTFHELRHTFGTQMAAAGAPYERSRSGWATPTQRRPRSTRTTRRMRPTARLSRSGHSAWRTAPTDQPQPLEFEAPVRLAFADDEPSSRRGVDGPARADARRPAPPRPLSRLRRHQPVARKR
jgi:integrase